MNILIIPNNTENNCFGLRNALPAEFLKDHSIKTSTNLKTYFHPELKKRVIDSTMLDWAEVVVLNRHYNGVTDALKGVIKYCKENNKLVVYETDDLLQGLNFHNPAYQLLVNSMPQVKMMATMADVCTTTTETLRNELLKYNKNVVVLPNCVDPAKWKERAKGNRRPVVGWAGGSSHIADLRLVVDVIKELKEEIDFEFVIFGLSAKSWREHIKELKNRHAEEAARYRAVPAPWYTETMELNRVLSSFSWVHQPFIPLKDFNKKLTELNFDIGICPLEDNRFNRCKSAVKFYEYAMVGTATLASHVTPYKEEVGYTAKNRPTKWKNKLKKLLLDEQFRDKLSKEQKHWVLKNRDINNKIKLWEDVYSGNLSNFRNC